MLFVLVSTWHPVFYLNIIEHGLDSTKFFTFLVELEPIFMSISHFLPGV